MNSGKDFTTEQINESNVNQLVNGKTVLHQAAAEGNAQNIRAFVKLGALVDLQDKEGMTPLYLAIQYGHIDAVVALLDAKASLKKWGANARPSSLSLLNQARKENTPARTEIVTLLEQYLLKLAQEGNIEAQLMLGYDYLSKETNEDQIEARKWFNEAFQNDHLDGKYMVAMMMLEGKGGPQNSQEAAQLLNAAAKSGHENAQYVVNRIKNNLESAKLAMIKQRLESLENNNQATKPKSMSKHEIKPLAESSKKAQEKKQRRKPVQPAEKRGESPKIETPQSEIVTPKMLFANGLRAKKKELVILCSKVRSQAINSQSTQIKELQDAITKAIITSCNILAQPLKEGVNNARNKDRLCKLETNLSDLKAVEKHIVAIKVQGKIITDASVLFRALQGKSAYPKSLRATQKSGFIDTKEKSESIFTSEEFSALQALLVNNEDTHDEAYTQGLAILEKKWGSLLEADKKITVHIDELKRFCSLLQTRAQEHSRFELLYLPGTPVVEASDVIGSDKLSKVKETHKIIKTRLGIAEEKTVQDCVEKPLKVDGSALRPEEKTAQDHVAESQKTVVPQGSSNRPQGQKVADKKSQTESTSLPTKKLSKPERKKAYEDKARIAARKKLEATKKRVLQQLLERHAARQIATEHNEFGRRKPQETKGTTESLNLLFKEKTMEAFNEAQKLKSIMKIVTEMSIWEPKRIYAIFESFAYLNDLVSLQHAHPAVKTVAEKLRDNIFHKYIKIKRMEDFNSAALLDMVTAWIRFLETTEMRFGASVAEVLGQVSSKALSEIYTLEEQISIEESCDTFEELMEFGQSQCYEKGCSLRLVLRVDSKCQSTVEKGHEIVIAPEGNTYIVYYKNKNNCKIAFFYCNEEQIALFSELIFDDKNLVEDSNPKAQEAYKQIYAAVSMKEGCTRFAEDIIGCEAGRFYWAITGAERGTLEQAAKGGHARASALLKKFGPKVFRPEHLERGKEARHFRVLASEKIKHHFACTPIDAPHPPALTFALPIHIPAQPTANSLSSAPVASLLALGNKADKLVAKKASP